MNHPYYYIHECTRVLKTRWQEGFYLAFVRKLTGNYFKKKKDAEKMLLKIKKLLNAKTTTKKYKR
jgi:hypothetical protein